MSSQRVQIPVLKQGSIKKGQWSTRVLTIDTATGTVTISRHNHPNNVLYHSLRVARVQMWPRYALSYIANGMEGLTTHLTLRIVGECVPVPSTFQNSPPPPNVISDSDSPRRESSAVSSSFSFTSSDAAKRSRPQSSSMNWLEDAWMIQFTTYESYELAVRLLSRMRGSDGVEVGAMMPYLEGDLDNVRKVWERYCSFHDISLHSDSVF